MIKVIKYYQKNETKNGSFYEASMTPDGEHKQSSFTCIELCDPNSIELQLLKYSVHDIIKKYNSIKIFYLRFCKNIIF